MAVPPPLPVLLPATRNDLRVLLRAARTAFAAQATVAMVEGLRTRIVAATRGAHLVGGYVAHRGEPGVLDCAPGALPRMTEGRIRFVEWAGAAPLEPGAYGIAEPPDGAELIPDRVLVPLLGFDRAGNRLGQGGGHYDRWLAAHPETIAIGVAWSVQEVDALDAQPWDMPLHLIVTETETIAP